MIRRVWVGKQRLDGRPIADADGVAGEQFETEVYAPYGMAVDHEGEGVLLEIGGHAENYISMPPMGDRIAPDNTLLIYYGDTEIEVGDDKIVIRVNGGTMSIDGKKIKTNMDIETTGDIIADQISLKNHKHTGVTAGGAASGVPIP
jgi:hypothetical protein